MLKREITYKFLNDEGVEETETGIYYFHLSEEELLEWQSKTKENLGEGLQRMVKEEDQENLFAFFKKVILDSFGVREDGGRIFVKSPELRAKFSNSMAYKTLFTELVSNEDAASIFIAGIMPKDLPQDKPQTTVVDTVKTP